MMKKFCLGLFLFISFSPAQGQDSPTLKVGMARKCYNLGLANGEFSPTESAPNLEAFKNAVYMPQKDFEKAVIQNLNSTFCKINREFRKSFLRGVRMGRPARDERLLARFLPGARKTSNRSYKGSLEKVMGPGQWNRFLKETSLSKAAPR